VRRDLAPSWLVSVCLVIAIVALIVPAQAQVRGVYPLGMNATNAGVTPGSGFTYANALLFYSRDRLRGPDGEVLATGRQYVLMDLNTLVWVGDKKIWFLGGAVPSASATLPVANNSLTSSAQGKISGGGGLADSFYQPLILAWRKHRADIRAVYGFLAPTGRFKAGASDNVGSGYWTSTISAGETFYVTENKATALSAFQMYEFHSHQQGTNIHPGQTLDLDYSLTQLLPLHEELQLQLGIVGYNQWQTTDKTGSNVTPAQAMAHYRVNALGVAANVVLPLRNVSVGFKYFKEFANRSTFEGYSLQLAAALNF
jgi:hypothetical protein